MQFPNGTGPGVRRIKRPLSAYHIRRKCYMEMFYEIMYLFFWFEDMMNSNINGNETRLTTVGKKNMTLGISVVGDPASHIDTMHEAATSSKPWRRSMAVADGWTFYVTNQMSPAWLYMSTCKLEQVNIDQCQRCNHWRDSVYVHLVQLRNWSMSVANNFRSLVFILYSAQVSIVHVNIKPNCSYILNQVREWRSYCFLYILWGFIQTGYKRH